MLKSIMTLVVCLVLAPTFADAQERQLENEQWREDINTAIAAIREGHPDPFQSVTEEEFTEKATILIEELPTLSDKDIALRLAALVALTEDGHTRLSLPRSVPELGFNPAHTDDEQAHPSMTFSNLPFRFYLFEEGLYIVEAVKGFEDYIGAKVVKFGDTAAEDAVATVRPILYAENDYTAKLYAADRLALTEVLEHFGFTDNINTVTLTLERRDEIETLSVAPLSGNDEYEIVTVVHATPPLAKRDSNKKQWYARIPRERALYIKMDEIEMFPETPTADFMAEALHEARRMRARKILLDLRDNTGGSSSFNAAIVNAFAQSEYNDYGRLYVLTGRTTFSAASMLMVAFEEYVNAIFVGEPSGARPTTYGDPRRIQLPNSGLTLRTSTLTWPSSFAGDFRPFIETHIDAAPSAPDYFAGEDSAIEAALAYKPPAGPAAQMAELFEKGKLQSGIIRFFTWLRSPIDGTHEDAVGDLIAYGHDYLDDGELRKGRFMMAMARDYFPTNADARVGLGRAMELSSDLESARERYEEALELNPAHKGAKDGLARLASQE